MYSNHLKARRRRLVWFSIFSFSFLALLFFRDHRDHVRHPPLTSDHGNYYRPGESSKFAVGSTVTNRELVQEAFRLRHYKLFNGRLGSNKDEVLRYRIKKTHLDQPPPLGSAYERREESPTERPSSDDINQSQAGAGEYGVVKGQADNDKNSVGDDDYEYFYAKPGSLRDKILLEDYGVNVYPPPSKKKSWKPWSFDLDPPRPPLPKPEHAYVPDNAPPNLV
ncbi:hypothetical protein EMPS_04227 [Entomortierella parvispora]|uniref:Uncharacterized protein n=1 Tax=Entomortierella parvispora TaxID=205924 RepID=A0A9P3H8A8_9FUNG|nr:hypothetical protein EMPS_04227 [Entomortierella parvispora]